MRVLATAAGFGAWAVGAKIGLHPLIALISHLKMLGQTFATPTSAGRPSAPCSCSSLRPMFDSWFMAVPGGVLVLLRPIHSHRLSPNCCSFGPQTRSGNRLVRFQSHAGAGIVWTLGLHESAGESISHRDSGHWNSIDANAVGHGNVQPSHPPRAQNDLSWRA